MTGYPQPPWGPGYAQPSPQGYGPRGPSDDHLWSLLSYLLGIVFSLVAPLIIYAVKKDESPYVRFHAAQALNMGITSLIYSVGAIIVAVVLAVPTHGFAIILVVLVMLAEAITQLVFLILAALAANRGERYQVPAPICLPLVH